MKRHQPHLQLWPKRPWILFITALALLSAGCSSLLPNSRENVRSSWLDYESVKQAYDKIEVGNTRAELKTLGFDVTGESNLQILSYLDVADKVKGIRFEKLEDGLQECLTAHDRCLAYVFEIRRQKINRVGNFWADFFNFRRNTKITGWRFNTMIVLVDDRVVYKI